MKPKDDQDLAVVEKAALEVVEELRKTPPSPEELQKAKNQVLARFIQRSRSNMGVAFLVGRAELAGSWKDLRVQLDRVQAMTAEEVSAAAVKYLTPEGRNVLWIRRKGSAAGTSPEAQKLERVMTMLQATWPSIKDPAMRKQVLDQARQKLLELQDPELRKKAEEFLERLEKTE